MRKITNIFVFVCALCASVNAYGQRQIDRSVLDNKDNKIQVLVPVKDAATQSNFNFSIAENRYAEASLCNVADSTVVATSKVVATYGCPIAGDMQPGKYLLKIEVFDTTPNDENRNIKARNENYTTLWFTCDLSAAKPGERMTLPAVYLQPNTL